MYNNIQRLIEQLRNEGSDHCQHAAGVIEMLQVELDLKLRKLTFLSNADALEQMYAAGLEQEREIFNISAELETVKSRYETVRRMNPRQFTNLFKTNIEQGIPFDELVDNMVKDKQCPLL